MPLVEVDKDPLPSAQDKEEKFFYILSNYFHYLINELYDIKKFFLTVRFSFIAFYQKDEAKHQNFYGQLLNLVPTCILHLNLIEIMSIEEFIIRRTLSFWCYFSAFLNHVKKEYKNFSHFLP